MKNFALFCSLAAALGGHASQVAAQEKSVVQSQWIVQTGHRVDDFGEGINNLVWSPDGKFLVTSVSYVGQLFVRDSNGQIWSRHELDEQITKICWSPDSRFLFVATTSGLRLWDRYKAAFVEFARSPTWMLSEGGLQEIGALKDGKLALYFSPEGEGKIDSIWLWDVRTGEKQKIWSNREETILRGFTVGERGEKFAVSTDESLTIYGSDGTKQREFPVGYPPNYQLGDDVFRPEHLRFSPDGNWLAGFELDGNEWKRWHLPSAKNSVGKSLGGFEQPEIYALSNSGEISGFVRSAKSNLEWAFREDGGWKTENLPKNQSEVDGSAEWGADSTFQKLAAGTTSGDVAIFDLPKRKVSSESVGGNAWANAVSFSRDGKRVVFGYGARGENGSSGELGVFDLETSRLERGLTAHFDQTGTDSGVNDAQFSPDGKWLVSTGDLANDAVGLWVFEAQKLRRAHAVALETARVCKFNWSHNGQSLVAGTHGGEVVFWQRFAASGANAKPRWTAPLRNRIESVRFRRAKRKNPPENPAQIQSYRRDFFARRKTFLERHTKRRNRAVERARMENQTPIQTQRRPEMVSGAGGFARRIHAFRGPRRPRRKFRFEERPSKT